MSNLPEPLPKLFNYIEEHKDQFIDNLRQAIAIQSVSSSPEKRNEVIKMVEWTGDRLKNLGVSVELKDVGAQTLFDGKKIPLPPVLFGTLGNSSSKKTLLIYGHLDVQPASIEDGWDSDPFTLSVRNEKLYGRGSTDDKGPVLCWFHTIQAYQALNQDIPFNLKFIFEGMEESGSIGLKDLLFEEKDKFLKGVDYTCISDNYWLGTEKPCLTYGLRGICYFFVEITCSCKDLHSGSYGGAVHEAMADLIYILNTLVDKEAKILIPGLYDDVAPMTCMEMSKYEKIDFNISAFREEIKTKQLCHNENKAKVLMHRWRYPALSIHGIEGAFSNPGEKTVIPRKVTGKFSIRIVPNQTPKLVEKYVVAHMNKKWEERGSINDMKCYLTNGSMPWVSDPKDHQYIAGVAATKHVYGVEPDFTREGGSIPVTLIFQEVTGKSVLLLPVGAGDDRAHSQNEKLDIRNYIGGTKLMAAYFYELGKLA